MDERPGLIVVHVKGSKAWQLFKEEPGGHRWQRVPPNEKRGRVHTSTITVAVLPEPTEVELVINDRELEIKAIRGTGAGGQKRNKTSNCIQLRHLPTGIMVRCESERSREQNRLTAIAHLRAQLWETEKSRAKDARDSDRKQQVGAGQRGDKRRTIRVQEDTVVDHVTGKRWRFKDYERGNL